MTLPVLAYPNEVEDSYPAVVPVVESEEVEYAACLLISGPPDFIARRSWGRSGVVPVSTTSYRNICYGFWCNHVRPQRASLFDFVAPTPLGTQKQFLDWWARYKTWMIGNGS